MTRFNSDDHWDALRACWDATDFGASVQDGDVVNLNRAAGAFASNEPETLSRAAFGASLAAIRGAVELAKSTNPELADRVNAAREAKRIAAISDAAAKKAEDDAAKRATRLAEKAAAEAVLQEKIRFEKLALKLKTEQPDEYRLQYDIARAAAEKIHNNERPRINVLIGQAISA